MSLPEAVLSNIYEPIADVQPRTDLVLVQPEEWIEVGEIDTSEVLEEIMDPGRVSERYVLRTAAQFKFPKEMPADIPNRVAYLAATGKEFRALYPDHSDLRTRRIQWGVVEKIAELGDNRFNADHPHYDDGLRLSLHNQLGGENANIPEILRSVGHAPDGQHKMGLSVPIRDAVLEMLYEQYPYFNDALAAAQAERGFGDDVRGSLERLHLENRIEDMTRTVQQLDARVYGYEGTPVFERDYRTKLAGGMDASGQRVPGKIDKAVARYQQLRDFPIPQGTFSMFTR